MNTISIGAQISGLRKSKNLTQEELARHLGVTKAAVSKWELAASFPDIAQLPRIASFFSVSIDELLDYRAQLSSEEVLEIAVEISRLLPDDTQAVLSACREAIKQYYSCPELIVVLSQLMLSGAVYEQPDSPNPEISTEIQEYLEHVISISTDSELIRKTQFLIANMQVLQNKNEEAIKCLEALMPQEPLEIETSLAAAYEKGGYSDKAIRLYQETLYWSMSRAFNSCMSLLLLVGNDIDQVDALVEIAKVLAEITSLGNGESTQVLALYFGAASAYKKCGEKKRAYDYLRRFADVAQNYRDYLVLDTSDNKIFDHIQDIINPVMNEDEQEYFENNVSGTYALGIKQMLPASPEWADAVDDDEFQAIIAQLDAIKP